MILKSLDLTDFRGFREASIELDPRLSVIDHPPDRPGHARR